MAQRASDSLVTCEALLYLSECRMGFESLRMTVASGKLPEVAHISGNVSKTLDNAPKPLARVAVMTDMKVCYDIFGVESCGTHHLNKRINFER